MCQNPDLEGDAICWPKCLIADNLVRGCPGAQVFVRKTPQKITAQAGAVASIAKALGITIPPSIMVRADSSSFRFAIAALAA
jgi:hypothetical protein